MKRSATALAAALLAALAAATLLYASGRGSPSVAGSSRQVIAQPNAERGIAEVLEPAIEDEAPVRRVAPIEGDASEEAAAEKDVFAFRVGGTVAIVEEDGWVNGFGSGSFAIDLAPTLRVPVQSGKWGFDVVRRDGELYIPEFDRPYGSPETREVRVTNFSIEAVTGTVEAPREPIVVGRRPIHIVAERTRPEHLDPKRKSRKKSGDGPR